MSPTKEHNKELNTHLKRMTKEVTTNETKLCGRVWMGSERGISQNQFTINFEAFILF